MIMQFIFIFETLYTICLKDNFVVCFLIFLHSYFPCTCAGMRRYYGFTLAPWGKERQSKNGHIKYSSYFTLSLFFFFVMLSLGLLTSKLLRLQSMKQRHIVVLQFL